MRVVRRHFLKGTLAAAFAGALPAVLARRAWASPYGPLVPDPDGILDLPEGFSYRIVDRGGDRMSDGYLVPRDPDGMGVFTGPSGEWILMRNHELSGSGPGGPYAEGQTPPPEAYDPTQNGAVTRVVFDPVSIEPVSSNLVLAGSARNCAGGVSPWGWLTCEETTATGHGYVFLCDPLADGVRPYDRIDAYGRFNHEAACVDPRSNTAYLTEDRYGGALYRFVPDRRRDPRVGRFQAMKAVGVDGFDTSVGLAVGDALEVEWVDIPDSTPVTDTVRFQARTAGALTVARGEGIWYFDRAVYFTATTGGQNGRGQVFRYAPDGNLRGGTLSLVAQATDPTALQFPDNITVAPWGDAFVAEDAGSNSHLRGIDPSGAVYDFARTTLSEVAGVCFSPDGRALFVNVQHAHITLVVTGPFPQPALVSAPDAGSPEGGSRSPPVLVSGSGGAAPVGEPPGGGGVAGSDGLADATPAAGAPAGGGGPPGAAGGAGHGPGQLGGAAGQAAGRGAGATATGDAGVAGAGGGASMGGSSGADATASAEIRGGCACDASGAPRTRAAGVVAALAAGTAILTRRAGRRSG